MHYAEILYKVCKLYRSSLYFISINMETTNDSESSSNEGDDFFQQAIVLPYRFEPSYTEEELLQRQIAKDQEAQPSSSFQPPESSDRVKDTFWCTCDRCISMATETECICCHESTHALQIVNKFDPEPNTESMDLGDYQQKCVTLHPDFDAHLNVGVLDTYFRSHKYNWRLFPNPRGPGGTLTNAQYRLVGYRFILDWLLQGERLGKRKRMPLPACVVNIIREKYPANDSEYTGFKYADLPTI